MDNKGTEFLPQTQILFDLLIELRVFATNTDCLIPIFFQPNVVDLRYLFLEQIRFRKFEVVPNTQFLFKKKNLTVIIYKTYFYQIIFLEFN